MKKPRIAKLPSGIGVTRNSNGKKKYWKVRLGKKFTGGKVVTRNFSTLVAARKWVTVDAAKRAAPKVDVQTLKEQSGTQAFSLSPKQLGEAIDAFRRCQDADLQLLDAVNFAIKHNKPKGGKVTIATGIKELIEFKRGKGKRPTYLNKLEAKLNRFARFFSAKTTLNEIDTQAVEKYLTALKQSPEGQLIETRHISVLFGWAVNKSYAAENPVKGVERPQIHRAPPVILSPEKAFDLLNVAEDLTPWVALGLFAGLRPEEARRLVWEDIDFKARHIDLPATKAKGRCRRIIPFLGHIEEWLLPFKEDKGSVAPANFRRRFWAMAERAGYRASKTKQGAGQEVSGWPKDVLRHSFGSYHLARWKSAGSTAELMGHRNSQMLYQHYREVIKKKEDIRRYWEIQPKKTGG